MKTLTSEQRDILHHTLHRAAGGLYCGGGRDMDLLVAAGFMEYAGKKSFVTDLITESPVPDVRPSRTMSERTKQQRQADEMDRQIFAIMMLYHQIPSLRSYDVQKLFSQLRAEIRKEMHPTDRKGTA